MVEMLSARILQLETDERIILRLMIAEMRVRV
jgi:hypothetical protein